AKQKTWTSQKSLVGPIWARVRMSTGRLKTDIDTSRRRACRAVGAACASARSTPSHTRVPHIAFPAEHRWRERQNWPAFRHERLTGRSRRGALKRAHLLIQRG